MSIERDAVATDNEVGMAACSQGRGAFVGIEGCHGRESMTVMTLDLELNVLLWGKKNFKASRRKEEYWFSLSEGILLYGIRP